MSLRAKDEEFTEEVSGLVKEITLEFLSPKNTLNSPKIPLKNFRKIRGMNEWIGSESSLIEIIPTGWDNRDKKLGFWPFPCGKARLNLVKKQGLSSRY